MMVKAPNLINNNDMPIGMCRAAQNDQIGVKTPTLLKGVGVIFSDFSMAADRMSWMVEFGRRAKYQLADLGRKV